MALILNLLETAASIYNTIINLNQSATNMIGLDVVWCRLLPYDNGEDVIVQEYTLHQYECPKNMKVVSNNANFNVGNFTIDLFGIKLAEQLEISIDIATWKSVYGENTIPQKGDFVLIPIMHRPYEVVSSSPVHTIGQQITSWKCILGEWKHTASRAESEDFRISIDELTNAQDRLFGETISKEVADAVNDVETAYNTTTYVDPFKDFDMNSIIVEDVFGKDRNLISSAYYSFINAKKPVTYKIDAIYEPEVNENHWIYSCWFKDNKGEQTYSIKLSFKYKDENYWYFDIDAKHKLEYGQKINIFRGLQINLTGIVDKSECEPKWQIKIPTNECLKANKKFPKFWESGIWKLSTNNNFNLFTAYKNNKEVLKFDISGNANLRINCNDSIKSIQIPKADLSKWTYIAFDIYKSYIRIVVNQVNYLATKTTNKVIYDEKLPINIKTFEFNNAALNNSNIDFNMTNIRLFENEYELGDTYKQDMYSQIVRNASKLILVDTPKPENNMSFVSPIR